MKKKKGFTIIELIGVLVVLAILVLIAIPVYMQIKKNIDQKNYKNKIELIEIAAAKYAEDTNIDVIYVNDLVISGYLDADNKIGDVLSPVDNERLNCYLVKSYKENGMYYSTFSKDKYEDDKQCIENIPSNISKSLKIEMYDSITGEKINYNEITKWWNKNDVLLKIKIAEEFKDKVTNIEWIEGYSTNVIDSGLEKKELVVHTDNILQQNYKVIATLEDGSKLSNTIRVYIDKIKPAFYSDDIIDTKWTTQIAYNIKAYDNESGLYGYKFIETDGACPSSKSNFNSQRKHTILTNGHKKVCIIDNVGNTNEKEFDVHTIDNTSMQCNFKVEGTKGNLVDDKQWYISNVKLTLTPKEVGESGVYLGISNTNNPVYTNYFELSDRHNAYISVNINQNTNGVKYYGYIKNKADTKNSCVYNAYVENEIQAPILLNASNSYDRIVANFSSGEAISGIKNITCELTDESGNKIGNGIVSGNNCIFKVTATKENTRRYFKKCITSYAGNSTCSKTENKITIGYCENVIPVNVGREIMISHDVYFSDPSKYTTSQNIRYASYCQALQYQSVYNGAVCSKNGVTNYIRYCSKKNGEGNCVMNTALSTCDFHNFYNQYGYTTINQYQSILEYFGDYGNSNWHVQQFSIKKLCPNPWLDSNQTICPYTTRGIYYVDNTQCNNADGGYGCDIHDWYDNN